MLVSQNMETLENNVSAARSVAKVFNTALIESRISSKSNLPNELTELLETPAAEAILQSVINLSQKEGISHSDASVLLINVFRKLDSLWTECLIQEGAESLQKIWKQ